jgi:hypothetical protein
MFEKQNLNQRVVDKLTTLLDLLGDDIWVQSFLRFFDSGAWQAKDSYQLKIQLKRKPHAMLKSNAKIRNFSLQIDILAPHFEFILDDDYSWEESTSAYYAYTDGGQAEERLENLDKIMLVMTRQIERGEVDVAIEFVVEENFHAVHAQEQKNEPFQKILHHYWKNEYHQSSQILAEMFYSRLSGEGTKTLLEEKIADILQREDTRLGRKMTEHELSNLTALLHQKINNTLMD